MIAVAQECRHAIANGSTNELAMRLPPHASRAGSNHSLLLPAAGWRISAFKLRSYTVWGYLLAGVIVCLCKERLEGPQFFATVTVGMLELASEGEACEDELGSGSAGPTFYVITNFF